MPPCTNTSGRAKRRSTRHARHVHGVTALVFNAEQSVVHVAHGAADVEAFEEGEGKWLHRMASRVEGIVGPAMRDLGAGYARHGLSALTARSRLAIIN